MVHERKARLEKLCQRLGVALVYLFGSRKAKGAAVLRGELTVETDPLTDLDIGVVTITPLPPPTRRHRLYRDLYSGLADLFEPLHVDLVLLQENHSVFQAEALKGNCVYQVDEQTRDDYELQVLRRAADFGPVLDLFLKERLEEVGR